MATQNARLYIGGILQQTPTEKLEDIFGKYGKILEIKRNRNFSFVQYADEGSSQSAISGENGKSYFGKVLDVQIAKASNRDSGPNDMKDGGGLRGPPGLFQGGPPFGSFDDKRDGGYRDGSPGFRGRPSGPPLDDRFGPPYMGGPGGGPYGGPGGGPPGGPSGGPHGPSGGPHGGPSGGPHGGQSGGPSGGPHGGPPQHGGPGNFGNQHGGGHHGNFGGPGRGGARPPFEDGYRDGPGFGGPPGGGGRGGFCGPPQGGNFRGAPPGGGMMEDNAPTMPPAPLAISHENRTNDVEIIVINRAITDYGEFIEQKLKALAFTVDLLFPNEEVPLRRVLANIASRGTLYAVLVTPLHRDKRSLTLNILHGAPQEHRNMLVEDAVTLISRNYEMYVMQTSEKNGRDLPPEDIRALLQQYVKGNPLNVPQIDKVLLYFTQEKARAEPINDPLSQSQQSQNQQQQNQPAKGTSLQEAELQNRILNILNKGGSGTPSGPPPLLTTPPNQGQKAPLLNDPSVQKAIDNLIQGFNPTSRPKRLA